MSDTSLGLKKLQRGINGCISPMLNYGVPTESWDLILVFIHLQRLPKNNSALSPWKDLDKFLTNRIQTLTCIRDIQVVNKFVNISQILALRLIIHFHHLGHPEHPIINHPFYVHDICITSIDIIVCPSKLL